MNDYSKQQLMQSFLRDAAASRPTTASSTTSTVRSNAFSQHAPVPHMMHYQPNEQNSTALVRVEQNDATEGMPNSLEQFKEYVRAWLELDNTIKKAQKFIKEKRQQRDQLSASISKFMCKYDIEDLHTKEGRIRCKVTQVKAPINQKIVKDKITTIFNGDQEKSQEILKKIYDERDVVEKVSLRRLRIS